MRKIQQPANIFPFNGLTQLSFFTFRQSFLYLYAFVLNQHPVLIRNLPAWLTMKRYAILFLKISIFILLLLIRSGEIDISPLFSRTRYRLATEFYVDTILSLAIFLLFLDFLQVVIVWFYRRRHKIRGEDNFVIGVNHIYSIVLTIGMIIGILSLFRINVREVFTSLSIIFAGIAIITKDYISNLINGMIITFGGQLSISDNVSIGQHRGKIVDITLQNIHLLNDDDDMIYIPNNTVLNSEVVNYTKREIKRTSIDFEIDLKYLKTVEELETNLIDVLKPFHDLIKEDSYYLRVADVKKDRLSLKFQYILKEPNKELERIIRRKAIRYLVEIIIEREKFVDKIPELPDANS